MKNEKIKQEDTKIERLKEIIKIAYKLKWIYSQKDSQHANLKPTPSYPLMQLSEVEKCMLAMVDDFELGRLREWYDYEVKKEVITSLCGFLILQDKEKTIVNRQVFI